MSRTSGDFTRHVGTAGAIFVAVVAAGDLVLHPLMAIRLATILPVLVAVLALWAARRAGWRSGAPMSLLVLAVVAVASAPLALLRAPDPVEGRAEVQGLLAGVAVALTLVSLVRGDPRRQDQARFGWIIALGLSLLVVLYELVTDRHLFIGPGLSWAESSRTIVAGAFRNPNDFAAVLVGMISATLSLLLARSARRRRLSPVTTVAPSADMWVPLVRDTPSHASRGHAEPRPRARAVLLVLAALAVVSVLLTQSRSGLLALAAVLAIHAWSVARLRTGLPRPSRGLLWTVAGLVAALAVAAFGVAALASHNPVPTMLRAAAEPGTARSDRLRLDLLRAALRYFDASDGLGTGAASFEPMLARDPHPGVATLTWLHDSFLELLLQYGTPLAAALLVVGLVAVTTAVRSIRRRPDATSVVLRAELLGAGIAFLALGTASASVVTTPIWWLLLGQVVSCAWALSRPPGPLPCPQWARKAAPKPQGCDATPLAVGPLTSARWRSPGGAAPSTHCHGSFYGTSNPAG